MQKLGIFTSLGEHRRTSPRKKGQDTSREEQSQAGMSFRNKVEPPPSTQKNSEGNPNGSVSASPIKVDYASSSRTPMAHIQFSSPSQPYQSINTGGFSSSLPIPPQYSQVHAAGPGMYGSIVHHQYPHPNTIRTVIQTAVPIINPVIIQSGINAKEEIEALEDQKDMVLKQYAKLYEMYEELKHKPHEPQQHREPPRNPPQQREPSISSHRIAIMQSQLTTLFADFQSDMDSAIDRIINKCLHDGRQEISRIASATTVEVRYG